MDEIINELLEVMEVMYDIYLPFDAGYCEVCDSHAPKDYDTGALAGPLAHKEDCFVIEVEKVMARARYRTAR